MEELVSEITVNIREVQHRAAALVSSIELSHNPNFHMYKVYITFKYD